MQTTVCPSRLVDEEPDTEAFIQWFVQVADFNSHGQPIGVKEWPRKGGVLRQDAKTVQAVNLLTNEWQYLPRSRQRDEPPPPAKLRPRR